jgi:hypothetical protein
MKVVRLSALGTGCVTTIVNNINTFNLSESMVLTTKKTSFVH